MIKEYEKIDHVLFTACGILLLGGFIMIYSSSSVLAYEKYADGAYFFKRQIMWAIIGMVLAAMSFYADTAKIRRFITPLLVMSAAMLFAVHFPGFGKKVGGATRWLQVGPLPAFQPFEIVKLFYVIYMAYVLSRDDIEIKQKLIKTLVATVVISGGLVLQRDFGATVIIIILYLLMLWVSGIDWKYYLLLVPGVAGIFYYLIIIEPYRLKRIFTYLNPWEDYYGAGWQTIQSLIAIGSGGILGLGLSQSQQKFHYLPTPHTDYIYSIIGEELGIWGALLTLVLFGVILWRGVYIGLNVKDRFLKLMASAITFMIVVQAFVNIGVATGLMPPKGTTLPFLSFGGSSLIVSMVGMGILLSISRELHGEKR